MARRPSREAFLSGCCSPRPRPSPGDGLRSRGGGRVLSHQTRWTRRPGLPDAARRRLGGVWLPDGRPGATVGPPRLLHGPPPPPAGTQSPLPGPAPLLRGDHDERPFGPHGRPRGGPRPERTQALRTRAPARFRVRGHRHQPAARDAGLSLRRAHSPRLSPTRGCLRIRSLPKHAISTPARFSQLSPLRRPAQPRARDQPSHCRETEALGVNGPQSVGFPAFSQGWVMGEGKVCLLSLSSVT